MAPTTLSARWVVANTQSSMPLLARAINNLGGIGTGRRAVQIRPFKLPSTSSSSASSSSSNNNNKSKLENNNSNKKQSKDEVRNMYVVRSIGPSEKTVIFIEDLTAKTRKEKAEESSLETSTTTSHTRWTHTVLESSSPHQSNGSIPTSFEAFLSRVLLGSGSGANVATTGNWLSRSTAISIEGFVFSIAGDWEIRIGSVAVKGAASGGNTRGVFVEATYLAVPYLPEGSTLVKDFLTTLFPPPAIASGEIEWITISDEELYEAGLISKLNLDKAGIDSEWEWSDEHSFLAYIKMLRLEGIL